MMTGEEVLRVEHLINNVVQGITETFAERGIPDVLSGYEFKSDFSEIGCRDHPEFYIGCKVCLSLKEFLKQ